MGKIYFQIVNELKSLLNYMAIFPTVRGFFPKDSNRDLMWFSSYDTMVLRLSGSYLFKGGVVLVDRPFAT